MLSRLSTLVALAVVSVAVTHPAAGQQQPAVLRDTSEAAIPTADAARAALSGTAAKNRDHLPIVFYGVLGAAATTAIAFHVDPDSGGYRDGWSTATDFPDKAVHALAAWAITTVGVDLGARPRYAALAVCGAGAAFEFAQGYVSPYDIAADCVGAAGAAAFRSWRSKRRARSNRPPATSAPR